jgi:hypothetical protein
LFSVSSKFTIIQYFCLCFIGERLDRGERGEGEGKGERMRGRQREKEKREGR